MVVAIGVRMGALIIQSMMIQFVLMAENYSNAEYAVNIIQR